MSPPVAQNAATSLGTRISEDSTQIKETEWDVIVIGSGYGGGIAASRLARTGKKVCLLERGKEFRPGQYPDTFAESQKEMQVHNKDGTVLGNRDSLYEFYLNDDMYVFKGCGLGGTSLVNANVALEADPRVFNSTNWPKEILDEMENKTFNGWYDKARSMLNPNPYPEGKTLPKIQAMEAAVAYEGGASQLHRPPITVTFEERLNQAGIYQPACNDCGDCCTGCNVGAKNTTLMNYLPDAKNFGAHIYTQTEVRSISKKKDGSGWTVWYRPLNDRQKFDGAGDMFINAKVVVVSGGTLGSTEIMLRSKERGLALSESLGDKFSGNGDLLGFAFDTKFPIENIVDHQRKVGPCITTVIDRRALPGEDLSKGFVVEDGTHPIAIAKIYAALLATTHPFTGETFNKWLEYTGDLILDSTKAFDHSLSYLVMAQDSATGKLKLEKDDIRVDWQGVGKEEFVNHVYEYLKEITKHQLNGTFIEDPITAGWLGTKKKLITVHPLGGCVMGDDPETSVVNHKCQVWNPEGGVYDGLYIMDGSVIPSCIGVNPFLTISAVSERAVHLLAADRNWQIAEGYTTEPQATKTTAIGVSFTETMKGWFTVGEQKSYQEGMKQGKKTNTPISFTVTVTSEDLDKMVASPEHAANIVGTVKAPVISNHDLVITKGVFNLFMDDPDVIDQKLMKYNLNLQDHEGNKYYFKGFKVIKDNAGGLNSWDQTTTLYTTVYKGDKEDPAQLFGMGILYIQILDFAKQLTTMNIINAPDRKTRLEYLAKFGKYFAGALWDVYGSVGSTVGSNTQARKKRPLDLPVPEIYDVKTADGITLRLTRYPVDEGKKAKGPLLALHGMGVSSRIYLMDTIQESMAEYLHKNDYDLWLMDWRLSTDLQYAAKVQNLDVIAQNDFEPAVDKILEITKSKDVLALVHCVGSLTFFMTLGLGKLKGKIRAIAASSVMFNPIPGTYKYYQAKFHLTGALEALGIHNVNPSLDQGVFNKITGWQNLIATGTHEKCDSAVCHRITFMYGLLWQHEMLNTATHNILNEHFGPGSVDVFDQISKFVRHGHLVDDKDKEVYMPNMAEILKDIPIFVLSGEKNATWIPESTEKSFNYLAEKNGPKNIERYVAPGYGHLDPIFGKNAYKDTFPVFLKFLEKHV